MKIMAKHTSARARQQSPHVRQPTASITDVSQSPRTEEHDLRKDNDSPKTKIEALAEIICAAGSESAAALLVLMATLETSTDPRVFAHAVKHFAFTRCGELNV